MDKNLEKQFKEIIEKNLPAQVGETLQKELKELERLRAGNFEERALRTEAKVRELERNQENQLKKEQELLDFKKDLEKREEKLVTETMINELKISYEQKIGAAYNEVNKRILGNSTIRESVQNYSIMPLITTTETKDYSGNSTKNEFQTGSIPLTDSKTTETEEN